MQIIYEPHPVSPERKAELKASGYKIIDAQFAPAESPAEAHDAPAATPKRTRKSSKA